MFWSREARRKTLLRKAELFEASLLPRMEDADRSQVIGNVKWELYEIEHDEMITKMEQKAKERIARGLHKAQKKKKRKKKNG